MSVLGRVGYGLTYRGELLSLAAARGALGVFASEPVCRRLWQIGDQVRERFADSVRRIGVAAELQGPSPRLSFSFSPAGRITGLGLQTLFVQECLKRSVLTNGNLLPSYAHGDREVEESGRVFEQALVVVARAIAERSLLRHLQVPPLRFFYEDDALESD
jgi:glutamate-1-semialdehyde 2,1-aminomutase